MAGVPFMTPVASHWWLDRCFLYVGRMTEAKGVPHIIRAWFKLVNELDNQCPPLWLAGGLPQEVDGIREIVGRDLVEQYEKEQRICWWGYLNSSGISTLLLKAFVLVTHSLYEPGGRVVLEAMSQGIPVIATRHGVAVELVTDWHTGFLVEYGDIDSLAIRMKHFVRQPLLRHAMGHAAHRKVTDLLSERNFIEAHLKTYEQALNGKPGPTILTAPSNVMRGRPQGFGGVYPFESERIDHEKVGNFFVRACGEPDRGPIELEPTGRSRLWLFERHGQRFVAKHAFSTYRRRPLWDKGFKGGLAETQRFRVANERLASSCPGIAKILASDDRLGLLIRRELGAASVERSTLNDCASVLLSFHQSSPMGIDIEHFRRAINHDWQILNDDDVVSALDELQTKWASAGYGWHPWQPMSLRLCWRWLDLGLARGWLSIPPELFNLRRHVSEEYEIARNEDHDATFGPCHGDCEPDNFCFNEPQNLVLIDAERFHPGYFGADWSTLILKVADTELRPSETTAFIHSAWELVRSAVATPRLLLSWLKWIIAMDICRNYALMNRPALKVNLSRWRELTTCEI